jgi:hypothetical protein
MTARAEVVMHGTTMRFAPASRPVITITRWWRISRPGIGFAARGMSASRSGEPTNDDQLTLMSMTAPNRLIRVSTKPGSSLANEAV